MKVQQFFYNLFPIRRVYGVEPKKPDTGGTAPWQSGSAGGREKGGMMKEQDLKRIIIMGIQYDPSDTGSSVKERYQAFLKRLNDEISGEERSSGARKR